MDGREFGHTPRGPAELIANTTEALSSRYKADAKSASFHSDLPSFLENQSKQAQQFESLFIVGRVAKVCREAVAELMLAEEGRKQRLDSCAKQIQAQWYLKYFCGEIDKDGIKAAAKDITESEARRLTDKWRDAWQEASRLEKKLAETPKHDDDHADHIESFTAAADRYRDARTKLLKFIAPKGQAFEPGHSYANDWKLECAAYNAQQQKKSQSDGRGVLPNGPEVKRRRKAIKMNQTDFATEVKLSNRTVRRVEAGGLRVDLKTIERIAKFFDVEPVRLILHDKGPRAGSGRHFLTFGIAIAVGLWISQLFMSV